MGETLQPLTPVFNRSLRIEIFSLLIQERLQDVGSDSNQGKVALLDGI